MIVVKHCPGKVKPPRAHDHQTGSEMTKPLTREELGRKRKAAQLAIESERERWEKRLPGWKPNWRRPTCPRTIAGKRCLRWGYDSYRGQHCLCFRYQRIFDHQRSWNKPGEKLLTMAPYPGGWSNDDLLKLYHDIKGWDLDIIHEDAAPYGFGTHLIVVGTIEIIRQLTSDHSWVASLRL